MIAVYTETPEQTADPAYCCDGCGITCVPMRAFHWGTPQEHAEEHAEGVLLCATCAQQLMVELYRHLIGGQDTALIAVLPINTTHARMLVRERKVAREAFDALTRRIELPKLLRTAVHRMEQAADTFMAHVGRSATWR